MKKTVLCSLELVCASTLLARTVALWPLNWDTANGTIDGRCAIDVANNLSPDAALVYDWGSFSAMGWTLPPNPDATVFYLFEPTNSTVVFSAGTAAAKNYAYSTTVGNYVTADKDFTVEGWFRFPELPASGSLFFVADGDGVNIAGNQRWFLTFRQNSGGHNGVTWQIFSAALGTGDALLHTLTSAETAAITKGWHHFALSFEHCNADNKAVWRFYQDGALWGALTNSAFTGTVNSSGYFGLGGRNNVGNVFKGALSYCRLSDTALDTADFLNHSLSFPPITKGFWKLDRAADGVVNGAPIIGTGHLSGGFLAWQVNSDSGAAYSDSTMLPDADCAFTGNPPNTTVTLPDGNAGSMLSRQVNIRSAMRVNGPGEHLSLTNDFTAEGWVKPEWRDAGGWGNYHHICSTRVKAIEGWVLQLSGTQESLKVCVHVQDTQGTLFATPPVLADLSAHEGLWTHLALVYDCVGGANGRGLWSCFVNGVLMGTAENETAPRDGGVEPEAGFKFGTTGHMCAFPGKLDCWRLSKAALRPTQFLCASENCEAATDVIALWPLNAQDGAYVDGTDVMGAYTFQAKFAAKYLASGCDGAPEIPDVSTAANGSTGFRVSETAASSYLLCNNSPAVAALASANGSTFEVYLKRTAESVSGNNEFIFLVSDGPLSLSNLGNLRANLNYRLNTGFWLFVRDIITSDAQFLDANGKPATLPLNEWTHMALTYAREDGNHVFKLYLNGVLRGTVTRTSGTVVTPVVLYLGGRPQSEHSFRGQFSCLRISEGVLAPKDMLCSNAWDTATAAYWPLDSANGALDLVSRVHGADGARGFTASSAITGSANGARTSVPRPDETAEFDGVRARNTGSVALGSGGYAQALCVGAETDVRAAFTVEGWLNWANSQGAAKEVVAGTYNPASNVKGGWKLVLDSTGATPALRIYAKGVHPVSELADGVLLADASCLRDAWHHVALRYDPTSGNGTWSLLLDGKSTGSVVENAWTFSGLFSQPTFRLGAFSGETSFAGGLDMWRIKGGVLGKDDILWTVLAGTLFTVR